MSATVSRPLGARLTLRRRRSRRPRALLHAGLLFGALVALALAGALVLDDPSHASLADAGLAPGSPGHLLGTDPLGRDVLSWIAASIVTSLRLSLSVVFLSAVAGVIIGLGAGYFGGMVDAGLMRLADLQLAVPPFLLFLAASALVRPSLTSLVLLFSVVSWVPYARLVRTRVLSERERSHIAAARLAGSGRIRILAVHLLPSVAALVLVLGSLQAGYVLMWEATLSFLGLGINPPAHSLGFLIAGAKDRLTEAWWVVLAPGVTIALLVFAFNLLGEGLRELFREDEVALR